MNSRIIKINEYKVKEHLGEFVRETVEETHNSMIDVEVDVLCNAQRYERIPERRDTLSRDLQKVQKRNVYLSR